MRDYELLDEFAGHRVDPKIIEGLVASDGKSVQVGSTVRQFPAPPERDGDRELWARFHKRVTGLVSQETRKSRRMNAHLRSARGVGGKAKHQKMYLRISDNKPRMAKPRSVFGEIVQTPYEARATARRPWTVRKERRARNRRARVGRRNAR